MTLAELRQRWIRIYKTIDREMEWRNKRYPVGDPERETELAEINLLLADTLALKDELKRRIKADEEAAIQASEQPRLLDAPRRNSYG
jgi:hypothetical protein